MDHVAACQFPKAPQSLPVPTSSNPALYQGHHLLVGNDPEIRFLVRYDIVRQEDIEWLGVLHKGELLVLITAKT